MKYFCDFFTMKATSTPDTGITTTAIRVITGDMVSIITTTPTRVAMEVMIIVMLWFRPVPSVSTYIVCDSREDIAVWPALKILHRHPVDLLGYLPAHPIGNLLADRRHDPALDQTEDS